MARPAQERGSDPRDVQQDDNHEQSELARHESRLQELEQTRHRFEALLKLVGMYASGWFDQSPAVLNAVWPDALANYGHEPARRPPEMELLGYARDVLGLDQLAQWMQTPIPFLGRQTPLEAIQTEEGRQRIRVHLDHISGGVFD